MVKKNLFIVNTPFHLLTSFILSKGRFQKDENYLALIHPHGYEKWQDSDVMQYMSSINCGYKEVFPLITWMSRKNKKQSYRKQVNEVKNTIGKIEIDQIFLGSDIDVQNQLLVGALGKKEFYRYEDGLYSYYNQNRRRPISHMLFHKLKIHAIEWIAGIKNGPDINTSTASASKAGICDYMYKPKLLKRYSPQAYEITSALIQMAMCDLQENTRLDSVMKKASILYLSQPLVEQGKFTIEEEFGMLRDIVETLDENQVFYYKSHPNDSPEKIKFYKKELPKMEFFESIEPVEIAFYSEKNLHAVISYQSTALMFTDKFAERKLESISLASFYRDSLHPLYRDIMQEAGVKFPKNMEEISSLLSHIN
ncbi:polysialyltransferase family glycosyltransferase [Anaerosinus massiliensis]|uniref:polysialyltransferase family glycosyltransferase n=1 Tax=Massilibacillus massiliensis TaxID=1806837 RepID=UPI000AC0F490|nr:polysialyltransferase family glycosyltransferase [Massilibacillus massiliensis]